MVPDLIFQDVIILIYVKNFTLNKKNDKSTDLYHDHLKELYPRCHYSDL